MDPMHAVFCTRSDRPRRAVWSAWVLTNSKVNCQISFFLLPNDPFVDWPTASLFMVSRRSSDTELHENCSPLEYRAWKDLRLADFALLLPFSSAVPAETFSSPYMLVRLLDNVMRSFFEVDEVECDYLGN